MEPADPSPTPPPWIQNDPPRSADPPGGAAAPASAAGAVDRWLLLGLLTALASLLAVAFALSRRPEAPAHPSARAGVAGAARTAGTSVKASAVSTSKEPAASPPTARRARSWETGQRRRRAGPRP